MGDPPIKDGSDEVNVSFFLNPSGSVVSTIVPKMLTADSASYLYKELGFKTAVGMPFKDIATCDLLFMRTLPEADDANARTALRRMMEVGTGVIVPKDELERNPLENAVALVSLTEAAESGGKVRAILCVVLSCLVDIVLGKGGRVGEDGTAIQCVKRYIMHCFDGSSRSATFSVARLFWALPPSFRGSDAF